MKTKKPFSSVILSDGKILEIYEPDLLSWLRASFLQIRKEEELQVGTIIPYLIVQISEIDGNKINLETLFEISIEDYGKILQVIEAFSTDINSKLK